MSSNSKILKVGEVFMIHHEGELRVNVERKLKSDIKRRYPEVVLNEEEGAFNPDIVLPLPGSVNEHGVVSDQARVTLQLVWDVLRSFDFAFGPMPDVNEGDPYKDSWLRPLLS